MPQQVMPCYHGECAPLPGPVFRLQRVHVVESELLVFVAADGSGAQSRHSKLGSSSSLPLQNELDGCPSKEDINHDTTMFYRTLTFEQQQEALRQSNIILKPPIPRKPKLPPMTAEHGGCCKSAGDTNLQMLSIAAGSAANSVGAHDDPVSSEATSTDSEVKDEATHLNDEEDDFSEPAYPCICQHLEEHGRTDTIEVDEVHSTAAVRKFWLKKSMEDADISMRYRSARDPGQSQATTSSSSSSASSGLSYCAPRPQRIERPRLPPRLPPHPCRSVKLGRPSPRPPAARGAGPMQQSCDEAVSPQSPTSSVPTDAPAVVVAAAAAATATNSSAGVVVPAVAERVGSTSASEDPPFPANSLPARTRPLTAATRIDTLERNRIDAIEDEHKYETLDHAARPGYYSEDEGVCCTNIHSQLAKKAKELVRPYQKGDHPRDRPPIPAKPPRSTIAKVPRPPSNEGISDSEANYKESLDLVQEVKTAAQLSGYEPIDTSRSAVPPLPGVPTKGPLKKKETNTTKVVTIAEGMEEGGEKKFRPVLESQSSIELKSAKARTEAPTDTVTSQIDVSVASKARGSRDNSKKDPAVESSKSDEKRGLIERVKGMKVENPFKKTDADSKDKEDEADSEERKPGLMGKMFKRDKDPKASADDDLDDKEKRSLSEKLSKVFHRDKKEGADVTSDTPPEEKVKLSDKLGRMFGKDSREPKDASDITDEDKKPSLMSKIFGKDSKEPTNKFDDEEDGSKPFPINRVFSRDARDDAESENADDVSERRTFSDKLSDFKHKVFSKKPNDEGDVAPIGDEQGEKKTFMERYFPVEKPTIQQIVLTEEMEPDLKKRRIGKITSFQQTMEVEGDLESPAKKLMKEKIDKLTTKFKEVQEMMPRTLSIKKETGSAPDEGIAEATEQNEGSAKHDYEVKTHIVFTKDQPAAVHKQVKAVSEASGPSDPNDRQPTPVPSEGSDRTADKTRVFYAKIGDSEIEVKEEHYGRIQMGDKKEPIYARPFKMLKRSLNELSKSTPSLSAKTDEPIEYIDAAEVEKHANDDDDEDNDNDVKDDQHVNHHYDELSEPGKKKKIVAELKVRGGQGSPRVIKIETQLVKGKSLSALNEPATMTTIKTVEKQKPPVPPRPRPTTPTIIGKPASQPATPVSSVDSPPLAALAERPSEDGSAAVPVRQRPLNGELAAEVAPAADKSAELESAPPTSTATVGTKKIPPPRPPPPRISTVTTKVTPTTITTTTVASGARPQTTTFRKPPKPQRPPPPKVTVTKTVLRTPLGSEMAKNDKFSVYCQTDVGLSTDLLARIEQVVSTGSGSVSGSPYRPPRSRSTSRENLCNLPGQSPGSLFQTQATFYDEPVRVRKAASLNESDLSKRISSLQIVEEEEQPPPLPPKVGSSIWTTRSPIPRRSLSESDLDSGDSVYYDCIAPDEYRSVKFAPEDDVRYYERVTDESRSNSLSQSTPPPSVAVSETNLNDLSSGVTEATKETAASSRGPFALQRDPSVDSNSDWSDQPGPKPKPSPSILLKKKSLMARSQRDPPGGSSTDSDNQAPVPPHPQPRKRTVKRSPVQQATAEPKVQPDGFKRHHASDDSGEDTDDLLKRATEVQNQLRKLLSFRTEQLRVCLEADMSSSTDADPVEAKAVSQDQNAKQDVRQHDDDHEEEHDEEHDEETSETARVSRLDDGSSDSEEEKELTPPPADPREKALTHAANVAREIASSEAVFADALKLVAEDFKGAINCGREERGDILIPDEVLESILLYLPELLKFSLDLLENLNARVERYDTDKIIADVFVKTGQFLKLYSHYIKDYQARCNYLDDARKRYPEFHQVVQQFEASPRCQKLSVMQYMLKPVQRIPQYRLLLSDYLRHLDEDHPDRQNTEAALEIVSKVADHANEAIKQGDVHAEMVRLQNSLITTRFNVFSPGRMLLKQGNLLKQNRKTTQLKRVILFTNCLVYMTRIQSNENTFKLNRELPLMGLTVKPDEIFDTEFQVLSTSKSFTLIAQNQEERQEWVEAIREAVADFERKRRTFVKSASLKGRNGNDGPDAGLDETEEAEVDRAPVWTPDSRVTMCRICKVTFTTFRRRHHCRACGGVVCGVCSKREAWFKYNGGSYERVCDDCVIRLPRERLKSTAGLPEMGPTTPAADTARNSNILFEVRGANDEDCTMSGYLKMYRKGNWKRYWYVLKERVLYVYKASADVAPMEQMVVLGYEVVDGGDSSKKVEPADACFKLRHKGLEDVVLCADDPDTAAKWKQKIRDASKI